MADRRILVDTSVLIDLFRKTDKRNALLFSLVEQGYTYCISAVTDYEIYRGALLVQISFWDELLEKIEVLPFDKTTSRIAVDLNAKLKLKNLQIAIPDLFIAATAISLKLPIATLNRKHFDRIESLTIVG